MCKAWAALVSSPNLTCSSVFSEWNAILSAPSHDGLMPWTIFPLLCFRNILQNHLLQQLGNSCTRTDPFPGPMLPSITAARVYSLCAHKDDGGAASYSSRISGFIECWTGGPVHSLAFASKPWSHIYMHEQLALSHTHLSVRCLASEDLHVCLFCAHTSDFHQHVLLTRSNDCLWFVVVVFIFMAKLCSEWVHTLTQFNSDSNSLHTLLHVRRSSYSWAWVQVFPVLDVNWKSVSSTGDCECVFGDKVCCMCEQVMSTHFPLCCSSAFAAVFTHGTY